jgi:hypothetical protein
MRDSEALDVEFVVYYESEPEVGVEKVSVQPFEKRQASAVHRFPQFRGPLSQTRQTSRQFLGGWLWHQFTLAGN